MNGKASLGAASFEPYLNAAHVAFRSGSYQESGMSGLYGGSFSRGVTYTTLGSRMAHELSFGETVAMLRGDIGWQYAFGDTNAASRHSLSMASNESFGVKGTPIAKSAALVELGLDWSIGIGKLLSLSYQGQYAAKQQQHGVKAKLEVRF